MNDILLGLKRSSINHWFATSVLGLVTGALLILCFKLSSDLDWLARHQPIHVIPGAAEGVYAAGVTHYNVINAARYLAGLGINLTPVNAPARLEELQSYIAPEALPAFQAEREERVREIRSQQQSRAFFADEPDSLTQSDGVYEYRSRGRWDIRSGSLAMSSLRYELVMRFSVAQADRSNPYGIQVQHIEMKPLGERGPKAEAAAAPL